MKTVILFGSPRKAGNTRQLVNVFSETMKKNGHDIRLLNLNDMNVRPCQGCLMCAKEGKCRINDDMKDIRRYMLESDLVVYATPTYWWGPSAQLKLVIDRSISFLDENLDSRIKGKKAVTLIPVATHLSTRSPRSLRCSKGLSIFCPSTILEVLRRPDARSREKSLRRHWKRRGSWLSL